MAPVFWQYKPSNEKAHMNVLYRGALLWNNLPADKTNMEFKAFKVFEKGNAGVTIYKWICIPGVK